VSMQVHRSPRCMSFVLVSQVVKQCTGARLQWKNSYLCVRDCCSIAPSIKPVLSCLRFQQVHNPTRLAARPFVSDAFAAASCGVCSALCIYLRCYPEASSGSRFLSPGILRCSQCSSQKRISEAILKPPFSFGPTWQN
jgi:hypothetical protein